VCWCWVHFKIIFIFCLTTLFSFWTQRHLTVFDKRHYYIFLQKWQKSQVSLNLLCTYHFKKVLNYNSSIVCWCWIHFKILFIFCLKQLYFHFGHSIIELDLTKGTIFYFKNGKKIQIEKIVVSVNLLRTYHFSKKS
jgi:hypothetical protein